MSEALKAIEDIKKEFEIYGSDVTLNKIVNGAYDPDIGDYTTTVTTIPVKAMISSTASYKMNELLLQSNAAYDMAIKFYHDEEITKDWSVAFDGDTYNIVRIEKKILQDVTMLYEVAVKK